MSMKWFVAAMMVVGASQAVLAQEEAAPAASEEAVVESSAIENISYNAETKTLTIKFDVGGTFEYYEVSAEVHDALISAESKGRYFTENIKNVFTSKKIAD